MLYKFLVDNRKEILALARKKSAVVTGDRPTSARSERGLPRCYDHLARELESVAKGLHKHLGRKHGAGSTARHGGELSRLGYTVSQVVHGYGVLCQAITELAETTKTPISAAEYRTFNHNLDDSIAAAVTGFMAHAGAEDADSNKRMGFLVHELRNALAAALVAQSLVKSGVVDPEGRTNALLERNLKRMRDILDHSFSEVRMHHDKAINLQPQLLFEAIEEVEATASEDARAKGLDLKIEVEPALQVNADSHYLVSALSNLVQNAIKYSNTGGTIWVRGRSAGKNAVLEVEDQCGGLPPGKARELFRPFVQKSANRTGLGLGLTICRKAVELNGGTLSVRDLPGKGCVFTITLPKWKSVRLAAGAHRGLSHTSS